MFAGAIAQKVKPIQLRTANCQLRENRKIPEKRTLLRQKITTGKPRIRLFSTFSASVWKQ
jgi:hypothetical protein